MHLKSITLSIVLLLSINCKSQQSEVWENFKTAKKNNIEPILPDFSYAGYKYSEVNIPHLKYKIFDVTTFGAIPNDKISDKDAINKAIKAATKNGEGIIYFPKGKYLINTQKDNKSIITISSSKIIFRGEDRKNTILFFEKDLPPTDPTKFWTCPSAIKVTTNKKNRFLTNIISNTKRETYSIKVKNASKIKKGDWVILKVLNNSIDIVEQDIQPLTPDLAWKSIINEGVKVNEHHQVAHIDGNKISFVEPIHYNIQAKHNWSLTSFEHVNHVGFENITFEGNWLKKFVHHRSAQDDSGWSILSISKAVNSWIKDCTFKNVNNSASFSSSSACTALNITIKGNLGHSAIHASRSTGILMANINDIAGMHHSIGVDGGATGTVIWRSKYASHTCFESHASQPRCTLFDNVEGGFFQGRAGGARQNLPNHGRYLVLWNFNETDIAEKDFRFIATGTWYWRIVPPIIVGFHGAGTTFKKDEVQIIESLGKPVTPESLFEEQLKLRLDKLPKWIKKLKNNI
ncbi:hypothetical protein A8C32_00570 [Flavivirga aquatica]|uniref:Pectate lyase superfamily protein domain-containing protein n=1 Tax=Flavivirga aquatica TaxID=1849968 RepID=A0A1E5TBN3_9FLAO|nr:DUF4955 domain-containing protein [Flavivirga aquatica]OEK08803.1 hypothetical protein A8C32_00570 [Flavivirga aquatica]